jgi:hypothetical protein
VAKYNPKVGDPEEWLPDRPTIDVETFEQLADSDLYIPRPSGKECRSLIFKSGMALNVEETQEELRDGIAELFRRGDGWLYVTDAQFGNKASLPAASVLDELLWIAEAFIDVAGAREQIKAREMNARLAKSGVQVARAELPRARSNGRR